MSDLAVPATYARRKCGLFMEIAACNIDTSNLECQKVIDGDITKLKALDLLPFMVREPKPGHFLLLQEDDYGRLQKQIALGKRWILALDSSDPNWQQIVWHLVVGESRKLHVVVLAHAFKSWEEDPGVDVNSIAHLLHDKKHDLRRILKMIASLEYSTYSQELLTLLQCRPAKFMNYLGLFARNMKTFMNQMEELSRTLDF